MCKTVNHCVVCTLEYLVGFLLKWFFSFIRCRTLCHHVESYVRRSVLFAASCILVALHPSYVASALVEGNSDVSKGLEWIRTWALHVAESDTDRDCYTVRMLTV